MRIKLYENRDFMRRTQIKLMQEEVHIWCIRWKEVIPVFEYYQLMLDQKEKEKMEEYYFYEDRMRYVGIIEFLGRSDNQRLYFMQEQEL